ncbi:CHC2 zinc finger domain-containing protein, partial [[Clostridium] innocuum]|nr:CHC2 zinc finger domain-containing protein [[Clostridium] innocuum]
MAENVFEAVKQSVSTREAAEFYGIKVSRTGMACCPFHDDKNPSMKVDQRFHCFGCGADGDVIDFTAKLFNLSPKEAAEKLAQDFGLIYDSQAPPRRRYARQKNEAQKFREDRQRCYRVLSDYYYLLKKWEADRSPSTPEEEPHPRFVEAIQKKAYVEYLLDLFLYESEEEQKVWIAEHTAEITHLERRLKIMAENKPTNRERLREITDGIEQGIKELFESEKYMCYLSVMSRFHRYSVNNTMLIYMQKPDATLVAGYNKWKDQFERHVKKGEHGITIIAPTPYKKKIEEQKLDPDTKAPILDKDGKIVTEEKEIEIPMFRPVKVFDVSQTDGKPLPELASSLSGNVPNYEAFMEALRRSAPVPITFEAMAADTDGYFSADHQKIAIRQGMSEVQTVSATVHEIAHSKLHNQKKIQIANDEQYQEIELFDKPGLFSNGRIARDNLPEGVYCYDLRGSDYDPGEPVCVEEQVVVNHAGSVLLTEPLELAENGRLMLTEEEGLNFVGGFSTLTQFLQEHRKDRHTEEVEAESISYAVCKYFGIETGENSFGYIASWSQGKELKELRASLETINKTSGTLISDIERHYKEICKERGIDPNAKKEPEMAVLDAEANQQEALFLIDDATYLHIQPCDSGWDYTLYDAASMKELDGGQLDMPELSRMKAVLQICDDNDLGRDSVKYAPLSMIETLQEAAYQQMQAEVSQMTASSQLPEAQEQALDEYPTPDEQVSTPDMQKYGYSYDGMLPVARERALELDAAGLTVYVLHEDNTESMVFDPQEIMDHGGLFGVDHEEWEKSPQ